MQHTQQALVDNRYRILKPLGGGGMAKVYLAHDEVLDRDVALKILRGQYAEDEEFVERFKREAQNAARLSHPNMVAVYDRGKTEDGSYYIAMEYVPGGTLKDRISPAGSLEAREAVAVAAQIAEALRAAHECGIVHRDVKPQNVLMAEGGDAKVGDFGIARAAAATTISGTSLILGTANYMSPEQAMGKTVTPRSDLYSLGVVLYEMITGRVPFQADNPVALAMKHVNEIPRSPAEVNPQVPQEIAALTMKLLAKNPEERYGDAAELLDDLERVRSGIPPVVAGMKETEKITAPLPLDLEERTQRTKVEPAATAPIAAPKRGGRRWGKLFPALLATLLLGLALLGGVWALTQGFFGVGSAEVPSLEGLTREKAQERLTGSGLTLGEVGETPSDSASVGTVVGQDPRAGTSARLETPVNITLSSGPERVAVPNLTGLSLSEAEPALSKVGLKLGRRDEAPSNTVPAGAVAKQDPAKGEEVQPGTAVNVVVSTAPKQQASPAQAPAPQAAPVQPLPIVRDNGDDNGKKGGKKGRGGRGRD